ncbi:hypothetical protein [Thermus filiformis]|uniref:Uncharacterized protein n=1 Tax=Thermus filiformis TaxID=276 RepID=A0A0D6XBA3_THEFI|nr:hypothetical protein [Thermus filiformis]KIX84606.1 hypothetical protein THFILI_04695 [Thermus filiformis]
MGAIISGLLNILQWLASTFANLAAWLVATIRAIAEWVLRLVELPLVWLWNRLVDVLNWAFVAIFWLLGHIVELPFIVLSVLVSLLPDMPASWTNLVSGSVIIPALSLANQILPISEALLAFQLWLGFYGLMAVWRLITFLRGGR